FYELSGFRVTRIIVNLIMISALVSIAPTERHLLISAYAVPIVATIVYFADRNLTKVLVYVSCLLGIYTGSLIFDYSPELKLAHFVIYALVLAAVTIGFEMLRIRIDSTPGRLTELAKEWYKTLDLQRLLPDILANVIEVTIAQRGLIIIIDPRTKKYVGHSLYNFKLNANQSIENLARKCYVLVHGQPFESPDIIAAFNNNNIYAEFFDSPPRSIMAEPLYNRAG